MIDSNDFSLQNYLDTLASEYRRKGFTVQYQPFVYGADFVPINTLVTASVGVAIDHDADFILSAQTFVCFETGGLVNLNPNMTVSLSDQSSQRQLQNEPLHLVGTFGTGQRPFLYFKPLVLRRRSTLLVTVTNSTLQNQNLRLSFQGVKAYTTRARRG
jgi:hypothetical protein